MSEGGQNEGRAQFVEVGFVLQIKDGWDLSILIVEGIIVPGFLFSGTEPAARS